MHPREIISNTFFTTDDYSTSSSIKTDGSNNSIFSTMRSDNLGVDNTTSESSNYRTPLSEAELDISSADLYENGSVLAVGGQQIKNMGYVDTHHGNNKQLKDNNSLPGNSFTSHTIQDSSIGNGSGKENCFLHPFGGQWEEGCQDCPRLKYEMSQMEEDLATALAAHSALSSQLTEALDEKEQLKTELSSQTSKLTTKLKSIEAVWASQKDSYCLKISALERAKNNAEKDVIILEEAMLEASSQSKAMKSQLLKKIQDLTLQISSERESSMRALDSSLEKQTKLHKQVEELTFKLNFQERKEAEMRRLLESDHQKKVKDAEDRSRSMVSNLTRNLEETRKAVDRLAVENKELKSAIDQLENERRNVLEFAEVSLKNH